MGSGVFAGTDLASVGIERVAEALGLGVRHVGGRTVCKCPLAEHEHDDLQPACVLGGDRPDAWYCHKCGQGGDAVGLVKAALRCDAAAAFDWLRDQHFLAARSNCADQTDAPHEDPLHELARRRGWMVEALEALGAVPHKQGGRPAEVRFPMRDADGEITGWRRRRADNQPFGRSEGAPKCLSVKGDKNGVICPWPLPDADGAPVLVVEGEADAAAVLSALPGFPVVGTPGANPGKDCLKYLQKLLAGRSVVLSPHPDDSGADWRDRVGRALRNVQCEVSYIPPEGGGILSSDADLDDRIRAGADLESLIDEALPWQDPNAESETIAEKLLGLVAAVEFVHSGDGSAWAVMPDGRALRLDARGSPFAAWLRHRFLEAHGKPARAGDVSDVIGALIGRARFEGPRREVYTRVAELDGNIYVDLGREDTKAVEITPDGWHVVERPPALFATSEALAPLPEPAQDAAPEDLEALVELLGLPAADAFLATAWLLGCLQPGRPFVLLLLIGAAGSGKSTRTRLLRMLVDPAGADGTLVASPPREGRDLFASASGTHVLALDNLSSMPRWLSDLLSSIATGSGQATRRLYTDNELAVIQVRQPVILNGIDIAGLGEDLMDRAIVLPCPPVEGVQTEAKLWDSARKTAPRILGALLDAAVVALKNRPGVNIPPERRPRMLDFATWIKAAEPALHQVPAWRDMDFLELYAANRRLASDELLEADPVGVMLLELAGERRWEGSASQLLDTLERMLEDERGPDKAAQIIKGKRWPSAPHVLGVRLRRLVPQLKAAGVVARQDRTGTRGRTWTLEPDVPF
jgi:energy-coupling factor transporter ATP-binding protein EcfA2